MRIGRSEIEANPDGVSVGGAFLEALALAGQVSRTQMSQPGSTAYQASISRYRPIMATAMGYTWITTNANSRLEQLATGYVYARMNLEAARQGLGFHPVSQALQEFKEMQGSYDRLNQILGTRAGQRVQMLVRLGYGGVSSKTPRWPLQSKLIGA
jgi:hypothetical protein